MPDTTRGDNQASNLPHDSAITHLRAQLEQEIARRQQAEKSLHDIEKQYTDVLDLMNEYAYSYRINPDGTTIREWQTLAFEHITGFDNEEIDALGGWNEYVHPDDQESAAALINSILHGEQVASELRFVTKSGDTRWIRSITCPVRDQASGRVVGFYGAGRDVTEEKALKAQQARFITNAMHELSHPVTTILMRLYLMRKQPERLNEHLDALQPIANHLRRMIEDMREVSYLEQGIVFLQKREGIMQQLVATAANGQEEKFKNRNVHLISQMVETPLQVMVDVERVHQAVSSLITNAINLTPEGETISIQVFSEISDGLEYATVVLSHQGTFGEPEHPTLVFHPFYRASEGHFTHTGLELTITREIIKLHGGSVSIQVEPGNIRVFHVKLPLIQ